jgi:uncharacterized protein (TIRG00374 family)
MIDPADASPTQESRPSPARQALIWIVKIVVSGGLLYVLLTRVDLARLWQTARTASFGWLVSALVLYLVMINIASWRWWLLTRAQHLSVSFKWLLNSYLVATFFNNFLPSNIGGDVIRIRDTAKTAGSKTVATMIVLVDRVIGLMGLVFVAAVGTTAAARMSDKIGPVGPGILWGILGVSVVMGSLAVMMPQGVATLLGPLRTLHQEWVEERIERLTTALSRFRDAPSALGFGCGGAIVVQGILVFYYAAVARGLHVNVALSHLAIVVPLSFIVQLLPVSVGGFGVREATFVLYLKPLGVPPESALALSFIAQVLIMIFSTSGAVAYLTRGK